MSRSRLQRTTAWSALIVLVASCVLASSAFAQERHHIYRGDAPPGAIGQAQLSRGEPRIGYYQPVEIQAPQGAQVALAVAGQFPAPKPAPQVIGMKIGEVYRFRVTGIPGRPGEEVYPSIEVIDRLYPPPGLKARFPIPVQLTQRELEMALGGQYVTRVIYLEDPTTALPIAQNADEQTFFEVAPDDDPLIVADTLGRPMAILRMGSRMPDLDEVAPTFVYNSPPTVPYRRQPAKLPPPLEKPPAAKEPQKQPEEVAPPLPQPVAPAVHREAAATAQPPWVSPTSWTRAVMGRWLGRRLGAGREEERR